ncbi:MAG TPA: hypothetical protein VLJ16_14280 [Acidobacteriota bacterium]|nr:hypothetical protein [Acidobacteriota bacterium]
MKAVDLWGVVFLAAAVSASAADGFGADKIKDNAKVFQAELEAMKGEAPQKVLDKLTGWKFEPLYAWKTEDPASKDFKANNIGKTRFSKQEVAEIFGQAGQYKVAVYVLQVGTDTASTGEVNEMGQTIGKDASHTIQIFTAIRLVFKDEKLVSVRTWPKMESSAVSGGTKLIR